MSNSHSLLAFDTATTVCSVALAAGGKIYTRRTNVARQHAQQLLPMIEAVIKDAELSLSALGALAVSIGPGSFVGLRIGVSVAQALSFANDLPIIPVSSLQLSAQTLCQAQDIDKALICVDAHAGQVYWGAYQKDDAGIMQPVCDDRASLPHEMNLDKYRDFTFAGDAWSTYSALPNPFENSILSLSPDARDLLIIAKKQWQLGQTIQADALQPCYLNQPVLNGVKK
jgi:tRNA threonylcarbamoyladenosine biosynthesis protein TsaB